MCPFTRVLDTKQYTIIGNDDYFLGVNLVFQPEKIEKHCNTYLLKTTEGLYLTNESIFYRLSVITEKSINSIKDMIDLTLAENDYIKHQYFSQKQQEYFDACRNFIETLNVFSLIDDEFLITQDFRKNNVILYSNGGQIFRPSCTQIDNMKIPYKTDTCYKHIPVSFEYLNRTLNGFLTPQGIIRDTSSKIICTNFPTYVNINLNTSSSLIVFKLANTYHVVKPETIKFKQLNFLNTLVHEKLEHTQILVEGFDFLKQLSEIELVNEAQGGWFVYSNKDAVTKVDSLIIPIANNIVSSLISI